MNRWLTAGSAVLLGGLAASGEDITLTTYYPSPRGVYDELQANRATVKELQTDRILLKDAATGRSVSLSMEGGRFFITDVEGQRRFLLLEFPEAAPR